MHPGAASDDDYYDKIGEINVLASVDQKAIFTEMHLNRTMDYSAEDTNTSHTLCSSWLSKFF
jgi:hypothetical protein